MGRARRRQLYREALAAGLSQDSRSLDEELRRNSEKLLDQESSVQPSLPLSPVERQHKQGPAKFFIGRIAIGHLEPTMEIQRNLSELAMGRGIYFSINGPPQARVIDPQEVTMLFGSDATPDKLNTYLSELYDQEIIDPAVGKSRRRVTLRTPLYVNARDVRVKRKIEDPYLTHEAARISKYALPNARNQLTLLFGRLESEYLRSTCVRMGRELLEDERLWWPQQQVTLSELGVYPAEPDPQYLEQLGLSPQS